MSQETAQYIVTNAQTADLPSLTTIFARAFHPNNPYQRRWNPDTPLVRQWWHDVYAAGISDANVATLVAKVPGSDEVLGVVRLQRLQPDEKGAGFWSQFPLTDDHAKEPCDALIRVMADARAEYMTSDAHYLLEVFGVDHGCQGKGLGGALLKRATEVADSEGVEIMVEANASAKALYERFGFEWRGEEVIPGSDYREFVLVRPHKGS